MKKIKVEVIFKDLNEVLSKFKIKNSVTIDVSEDESVITISPKKFFNTTTSGTIYKDNNNRLELNNMVYITEPFTLKKFKRPNWCEDSGYHKFAGEIILNTSDLIFAIKGLIDKSIEIDSFDIIEEEMEER